jgi:hypothetical protein
LILFVAVLYEIENFNLIERPIDLLAIAI